MVSDSIINASIPNASKDFAKKKRVNRSAKLKQCKLDARREQWLSQVRNKMCKEQASSEGGRQVNRTPIEAGNKSSHPFKDLEVRRQREDNYGSIHPDSDSESPTYSPTSSASGRNDSGNSYNGSSSSRSSSSSSSFSSGGFCSGSITEEEEGGGGDDGCLDDWEAMADELEAASSQDKPSHCQRTSTTEKEVFDQSGSKRELTDMSEGILGAVGDKPELDIMSVGGRPVANSSKAWRPDDAFRPQSLPNLLKQNSLPLMMSSEMHCGRGMNPWGRNPLVPAPTCCPICCEDLDFTDSNFLPCPCGFRLCLFCHKRIVEEDARCPGCRKPYQLETVEKETSVSSGSLTIRLARSCSMFSRA